MHVDPYGLFPVDSLPGFRRGQNNPPRRPQDWFDQLANWGAGWGDTLSFGITDWIRGKAGINDGIDHDSTAYGAGEWTGTVHGVAFAGAGVARGVSAVVGRRAAAREAAERAAFDDFFKNPMRDPSPDIPKFDPSAPRITPPGDFIPPRPPIRPGGWPPPVSPN
jgi:hypothetical protein